MSVLIKDMEMPTECHGCRWFYFQGTSCTEPKYYLDARCEMVESGQDWYGKDARGGWIGESIEHIPGWSGNYSHQHCVEMGTRASQCPLCELPSAQPERKNGKWIIKDNPGTGWYRVTCSECGEDVTSTAPCIGFYPNAKVTWDYCPNCGADMRGELE